MSEVSRSLNGKIVIMPTVLCDMEHVEACTGWRCVLATSSITFVA